MFGAKKKGLQPKPFQRLNVPKARVSNIKRAFHRLDHYLPICDHTQERRALLNGLTNAGREKFRSAYGE